MWFKGRREPKSAEDGVVTVGRRRGRAIILGEAGVAGRGRTHGWGSDVAEPRALDVRVGELSSNNSPLAPNHTTRCPKASKFWERVHQSFTFPLLP